MESNTNNNNNSSNSNSSGDGETWQNSENVMVAGREIQTLRTPNAASFADKLLLVWVSVDGKLLCSVGARNPNSPHPSLLRSATWGKEFTVPFDTGASAAPVLAAHDGVIHLIYPDKEHNLVHLQYFAKGIDYVWGRRAYLGAATDDQASLLWFQGALWCVYKLRRDSQVHWYRSKWTADDGWSDPKETRGLPTFGISHALVALRDRLQLLVEVMYPEPDQSSGAYELNSAEDGWTPAQKWDPIKSADTENLGLSVASLDDRCFMAFIIRSTIMLRQYTVDGWQEPQALSALKFPVRRETSAALVLLGNEVFCFWQPIGDNPLQWSSRLALPIPPLRNWMWKVEDQTSITDLTIPGTHDTAAAIVKINDGWFGRGRDAVLRRANNIVTQSLTITAQLDMGIRFFDLRCGYTSRPTDDDKAEQPQLIAVHDNYDCYDATSTVLTIASVLKDIYTWMKRNGSQYRDKTTREGILLSIKLDRDESVDTVATRFAKDMFDMITKDSDRAVRWRLATDFPKMGGPDGLRNSIQLIRRFKKPADAADTPFGINVFDAWPKNSSGPLLNLPGPPLQIQDHWKWMDFWNHFQQDVPTMKFALVQTYLEMKNSDTQSQLFLNFATGNGFWTPEELSLGSVDATSDTFLAGVNQKLDSYFTGENEFGRFGVILIDFAGDTEGLLARMVRTNFPPDDS